MTRRRAQSLWENEVCGNDEQGSHCSYAI